VKVGPGRVEVDVRHAAAPVRVVRFLELNALA
jgi:hypothetical protein